MNALDKITKILVENCNNGTLTPRYGLFETFAKIKQFERVNSKIAMVGIGDQNFDVLINKKYIQVHYTKKGRYVELHPWFAYFLEDKREPVVNLQITANEVFGWVKENLPKKPEHYSNEFFSLLREISTSIGEIGTYDEPFNYDGRKLIMMNDLVAPFLENRFLKRIKNEKGERIIIDKKLIEGCTLFINNRKQNVYYYGGDLKTKLEKVLRQKDFTYEKAIKTAKRIFGFRRNLLEGDSLKEGVKLKFHCGFGGGNVHLYFKKDETKSEVILSADMGNPTAAAKDVYKNFLRAYDSLSKENKS